jgi:hypothetical protein
LVSVLEREKSSSPGRSLPSAQELAEYRLSAQHPLTRQWIADDVRLELLAAECADDLLLVTDQQIAASRAERFAPGQPAQLLMNRWLDIGDGLSAMLSMRYEGLDVTLPFVDASLTSRPVETDDLVRPPGRRDGDIWLARSAVPPTMGSTAGRRD